MVTKPLAIIPVYLSNFEHQNVLWDCLRSIRRTAGTDVDILMVDDQSPNPGMKFFLRRAAQMWGCSLIVKPSNDGFASTVNVGLEIAQKDRRTAILVNQDIEFHQPGWLQAGMNDPAGIVGAKLMYPNMLIQHGGIYFSLLHQYFDHLFKFAPHNLPEANIRWMVPVTGALQFIRPDVLDTIGLYDPEYKISYDDVDFCIRARLADIPMAMNPGVAAIHHEGIVRHKARTPKIQKWLDDSHQRLPTKFQHVNFQSFAHPLTRGEFQMSTTNA